jgi:hypothetical protein
MWRVCGSPFFSPWIGQDGSRLRYKKSRLRGRQHSKGGRSNGMRHQRSEARDAHTHSVGDEPVQRGYKRTAVSGEYEAEEGVYTACDDVADQKSADVIRTDT